MYRLNFLPFFCFCLVTNCFNIPNVSVKSYYDRESEYCEEVSILQMYRLNFMLNSNYIPDDLVSILQMYRLNFISGRKKMAGVCFNTPNVSVKFTLHNICKYRGYSFNTPNVSVKFSLYHSSHFCGFLFQYSKCIG